MKTFIEWSNEQIQKWIEENSAGKERFHPNGTPMCEYPACVKPKNHTGEHSMGGIYGNEANG